jgi:hypothetical protein
MFLTLIVLFLLNLCRIRFLPHQTKHFKKRKQRKATSAETDSNINLPKESDQEGTALPKADKWARGQTKEARLQAVLVLWRKMVVAMKKKTQHRL